MGTKDFLEKFEKLKVHSNQDINILLLGETGVGKSTFINSIANYLTYKKFKHAEKEDLRILIPTTFTVTNKNFENVEVKIGYDDVNEYQEVGASATQDVKTYVFPIGEGKTRIRLIDTPGMADTRGVEQDDKNCEYILNYLSQIHELHAICFLMKPTNTRITVLFEYCVKQIMSRLEKSASKNMIFIFTNTRGTDYSGGETLPCLMKVIQNIKSQPPHVDIPISKKNVFYFDNEAFRILAALKNNVEYDDDVKEKFITSWNKSQEECWRMITYITGDASSNGLTPHLMQNTISVNEARRLIVQLSQPLADISELIYDNIRILDKHKRVLAIENQSLDDLKSRLYIPAVVLDIKQLTQPVTICKSSSCCDVIKVGDTKKWHYRQRCHDPCYLTNVDKEVIGHPGLVHCAAMNSGGKCTKCSCNFSSHMHIYYMTTPRDDQIKDDTISKSIQTKEKAISEKLRLIGEIDKRKRELEEERDVIIHTTAQFAHFLQNNAITPFNDAYEAYIQYLITREMGCGIDCDLEVIKNLQQLLNKYQEMKEAFGNSLELQKKFGGNSNIVTAVTPKVVMDSVTKLYQLKHNGKMIKDLLKSQKASRKAEHNKTCEYVNPVNASYTKVNSDDKGKKKDKTKMKYKSDNEHGNKKERKQNPKKNYKSENEDKNNPPKPYLRHFNNNFHQKSGQSSGSPHYNTNQDPNRRGPPPPYPGPPNYSQPGGRPDVKLDHSDSKMTMKVEFSYPEQKPQPPQQPPNYNHPPQQPYGYGPPPPQGYPPYGGGHYPPHYYPPPPQGPYPGPYYPPYGPPPPPPPGPSYHHNYPPQVPGGQNPPQGQAPFNSQQWRPYQGNQQRRGKQHGNRGRAHNQGFKRGSQKGKQQKTSGNSTNTQTDSDTSSSD